MKKEKIFWGLFFICAAIFMLVGRMGIFVGVNIFSIFITIFLVACLVKSIMHVEFGGILFSLAFLAIIYDRQLGIETITPWPILGAAVFGTIGLSMIFHNKHHWSHYHHEEYFNTVEEDNSNAVDVNASFGSVVKYVNSDDFERANINCTFGAAKVYFDHAMIPSGSAVINLHVSFAGVELYIPRTWKVVNNADVSFGAIDEKNRSAGMDTPVVTLIGSSSFAGIQIIYV